MLTLLNYFNVSERFDCFSNVYRDQDILSSNQSLRIISNLVAADAIHSSGLIDEIIRELLLFTAILVSLRSSEVDDLKAKVQLLHFGKLIVDFNLNTLFCVLFHGHKM